MDIISKKLIIGFYRIVRKTVKENNQEKIKSWYALPLSDMRDWVEEQLDIMGYPKSAFREAFLAHMFHEDSKEPYELWEFIRERCEPDPDTEEEEEEDI
jgi:hypothetical protein